MTKTQKTILKVVFENAHLTAEQIYFEVKKELPNVAIGTIYRNLNIFAKNNAVRRLSQGSSPDFFDGNTAPHYHIICMRCGKTKDFILPWLKNFISEHTKTKILSLELLAYYVCPDCEG